MIYRELCPITGERSDVIFSRPYNLPELLAMAGVKEAAAVLEGKDYEIRYCASSDMYFQSWVFDDMEASRHYTCDTASILPEISVQKLHIFSHMTEEILVVRQMFPENPPVVLDFGTNWGKWASMALAHGCDVYGVEVNRAAESFCAGRGIKMVKAEQLDGCPLFDFINVDQVLEHLGDPYGVVGKLRDALKPGGIIKLSVPGCGRLPGLMRSAQASGDNSILNERTLKPLAPLNHVNLFTNRALRLLGARLGLEPVRPPFMAWLGAGQLWNLPRQLNRNLVIPFKRYLQRGTYIWLRRPA